MKCDNRIRGCATDQSELHRQIGTPSVYYCCKCNGCGSSCNAKGSNTRGLIKNHETRVLPHE